MSKLDDLIVELCPEGMEYKKLIDVAIVRYGYPFDAQNFTDNPENIPIIQIRDILPAKAGTYYNRYLPAIRLFRFRTIPRVWRKQYEYYRDKLLSFKLKGNLT